MVTLLVTLMICVTVTLISLKGVHISIIVTHKYDTKETIQADGTPMSDEKYDEINEERAIYDEIMGTVQQIFRDEEVSDGRE